MQGSEDLRLPSHLRGSVIEHLKALRQGFEKRGWGGRVGFGQRPALIVVDFANGWTDPARNMGSNLDSAVENTCKLLAVAREAAIPIFFTVMAYGPDDVKGPFDAKLPQLQGDLSMGSEATELDPRLGRAPTEKLIVKKYTSAFRGTNLQQMLTGLAVDTLIVTGCSTSHCIYDTCSDAVAGFKVIVPEGTVGDRCELIHLVEMLDIDMVLGDVVPLEEVTAYLRGASRAHPSQVSTRAT